jgi:hypothetical protein
MEAKILSDARFVTRAKIRQARAMSADERILAGPRLFAGVCKRMKESLRDENPGVDESGIHQMLLKRLTILDKLEGRHRKP